MVSGRRVTLVESFTDRLIIHPSGHWSLRTTINNKGYSVISAGGREKIYGHRAAHILYLGPIPEGYDIDHLCRLRWCVCPFHIEAVTRSVNIRRAYPTCKRGHDLWDGTNVRTTPSGRTYCKPCNDLRNARRYASV